MNSSYSALLLFFHEKFAKFEESSENRISIDVVGGFAPRWVNVLKRYRKGIPGYRKGIPGYRKGMQDNIVTASSRI